MILRNLKMHIIGMNAQIDKDMIKSLNAFWTNDLVKLHSLKMG